MGISLKKKKPSKENKKRSKKSEDFPIPLTMRVLNQGGETEEVPLKDAQDILNSNAKIPKIDPKCFEPSPSNNQSVFNRVIFFRSIENSGLDFCGLQNKILMLKTHNSCFDKSQVGPSALVDSILNLLEDAIMTHESYKACEGAELVYSRQQEYNVKSREKREVLDLNRIFSDSERLDNYYRRQKNSVEARCINDAKHLLSCINDLHTQIRQLLRYCIDNQKQELVNLLCPALTFLCKIYELNNSSSSSIHLAYSGL